MLKQSRNDTVSSFFKVEDFQCLQLKKHLFSIQEQANTPFQHKDYKTGDDGLNEWRNMDQIHQAICDGPYITIEPSVSNNFKKQVDEDGVHSDNLKKENIFLEAFSIYKIITGSKAKQAPAKRSKGE